MFSDIYKEYNFQEVAERIANPDPDDGSRLRRLIQCDTGSLSLEDFMLLLSPAAEEHLETMAQTARSVTHRRFGNTVLIYAPLYLSNECRSSCSYCGFSRENIMPRITLTEDEVLREAAILHKSGIRQILLLTGEDYRHTPVEYIASVSRKLRETFASISVEIYPLKEEEYAYLRECGVDGLTIYQETYNPDRYREVHKRGMKKRMEYRLDCPDRAGRAGLRKINIGALLGLSDAPAAEIFFLGLHARYLIKRYWRSHISVSLPRLRPAEGFPDVPVVSDRSYVQFLTALRLFLPDANLVVSTRESADLRDNLSEICVTVMSAGSRTDPGGYSESGAKEQFAISDSRSVREMQGAIEKRGKEAVFVDWSPLLK